MYHTLSNILQFMCTFAAINLHCFILSSLPILNQKVRLFTMSTLFQYQFYNSNLACKLILDIVFLFLQFSFTLFIEASLDLRASLPHSLFQSHNNQLFPCVLFKFPTLFMVTLNDLIICLPISKTHFDPTNSFPWKPKGDSIKAASNLRWVIKKESAGIN